MNPLFGSATFEVLPKKFQDNDLNQARGGIGALQAFWGSVDEHTQNLIGILLTPFVESRDLSTAQGEALHMAAYRLALDMPRGVDASLVRRLLRLAPELHSKVGTLGGVEDAIFVLTGLSAEVESAWAPEDGWTFGDAEFGEGAVFSSTYVRDRNLGWTFGDAEFGDAEFGEHGEDLQAPYEMHIQLSLEPTEQQKALIDYACQKFGRSIDVPVILFPEDGTRWVVGKGATPQQQQLLSVVLPDGSLLSDGESLDFAPGIEASGSRIGIDTVITSSGLEIGDGVWGVDVINSPPDTQKTVKLPDGTTVEDD